jgi:hypothetical protein
VSTAVPLPTLSLSGILDGALRAARAHFRQLFVPVALPLALANGIFTVANQWASQRQAVGGPLVWTVFALSLAALLASKGLGSAVLTALAMHATAGRPARPARTWGWILRPRILGTVALAWLALAAGLSCCIVPGIYLGVLFGLAVPVMIEEQRFGIAALRRSAALMSYNPGRELASDPRVKGFVLSFVSWLLGYALTLLLQAPFLIVQQVLMFRELSGGGEADPTALAARLGWIQVPAAMFGTLGQTAAALYYGFGVALLYADVRRRREGSDLEAAILGISGLPPDAVWPDVPAAQATP